MLALPPLVLSILVAFGQATPLPSNEDVHHRHHRDGGLSTPEKEVGVYALQQQTPDQDDDVGRMMVISQLDDLSKAMSSDEDLERNPLEELADSAGPPNAESVRKAYADNIRHLNQLVDEINGIVAEDKQKLDKRPISVDANTVVGQQPIRHLLSIDEETVSCVGPHCKTDVDDALCVGPECHGERRKRDATSDYLFRRSNNNGLCIGPHCAEERSRIILPCFGPDCAAKADRVVAAAAAAPSAQPPPPILFPPPPCFGANCLQKGQEFNPHPLLGGEPFKPPTCVGPACAARAEEVKEVRNMPPCVGPECKSSHVMQQQQQQEQADIKALEKDAENLLRTIEGRYNEEISKLQVIDKKLHELNMEAGNRRGAATVQVPPPLQLPQKPKMEFGGRLKMEKDLMVAMHNDNGLMHEIPIARTNVLHIGIQDDKKKDEMEQKRLREEEEKKRSKEEEMKRIEESKKRREEEEQKKKNEEEQKKQKEAAAEEQKRKDAQMKRMEEIRKEIEKRKLEDEEKKKKDEEEEDEEGRKNILHVLYGKDSAGDKKDSSSSSKERESKASTTLPPESKIDDLSLRVDKEVADLLARSAKATASTPDSAGSPTNTVTSTTV